MGLAMSTSRAGWKVDVVGIWSGLCGPVYPAPPQMAVVNGFGGEGGGDVVKGDGVGKGMMVWVREGVVVWGKGVMMWEREGDGVGKGG